MTNKNTLGKFEYLIYSTLFTAWFWVLYQNIFFRCLPSMTTATSRLILGIFAVITIGIGCGVTIRKRRNFVSVALNASCPFAVYWLVTYHKTYAMLSSAVVVMATLLSLSYFVITISMYIRAKVKRVCKISVSKVVWASFLSARTVAILCLCVVFLTAIPALLGLPLLQSSTKPTIDTVGASNFTIESEIETLLVFSDGTWEELTAAERLDVLQKVANIESTYLGIPHELNVGATVLDDGVLGGYNDNTNSIIIDLTHLEHDDSYEVLDTVLHEARHAYQHSLISFYQIAAPEYKQLLVFKEVQQYDAEFSNYTHGSSNETFDDYYYQTCEEDARSYADERSWLYWYYIEDYLENDIVSD